MFTLINTINMSGYSKSQNKATQKYVKANYDDIKVRVPKGKRDQYKYLAASYGKSLNQLIVELLDSFDKNNVKKTPSK